MSSGRRARGARLVSPRAPTSKRRRLVAHEPDLRSWSAYLSSFHEEHPGITEEILSEACDADGTNPYDWSVTSAPRNPGVMALDLACGSGPLQIAAPHLHWVGIDRSPGELARAAKVLPRALLRGDGQCQPFRDATFDLVACSMALMLFDPVDDVLAEISRVLRDGGTLLLLLPGSFPLSNRDRVRYIRLLTALREARPAYPNTIHLGRIHARLDRAGFSVVADERRCFRYPIPDEHHARHFVESLYVPGCSHERIDRAMQLASTWTGSTIGIPLRRLVCRKLGGDCIRDHPDFFSDGAAGLASPTPRSTRASPRRG